MINRLPHNTATLMDIPNRLPHNSAALMPAPTGNAPITPISSTSPWSPPMAAYVPGLTPGEQVAQGGRSFGGTAKLFGDPLVQSSLEARRAQKKALTGRDYSPQELQGIAAGEVGAYLQKELAAREYALKEYNIKEQGRQFGATLGQRQAEFGAEFGLAQKKFGLEERRFEWNQDTWKADYDFRFKAWETASQLDRDKFNENKRQFEIENKFNYEKFLEMMRQFNEKHDLDERTMQLKADELDSADWTNIAKLALASPLLYAQLARTLWGSTNPWGDLKKGATSAYNAIFGDTDPSELEGIDPEAIIQNPDGTWSVPGFEDVVDTGGDIIEDLTNTGVSDTGILDTIDDFTNTGVTDFLSQSSAPALVTQGADALTNTAAFTLDTGGVDALTPAAGSFPYLGAAKMAYTGLTNPSGLVSPSTVSTIANAVSYIAGGAATGLSAATGIGAAVALGIMYGKANFGGTQYSMDPWDPNNRGLLINGAGGTAGVLAGTEMQFASIINQDALKERFKSQFNFDPTNMARNDPRMPKVIAWVDKQPEVRSAQANYQKYITDNYTWVQGDESGNSGYVKNDELLKRSFGY